MCEIPTRLVSEGVKIVPDHYGHALPVGGELHDVQYLEVKVLAHDIYRDCVVGARVEVEAEILGCRHQRILVG
jgi:hypothetical protein